MTDDLLRDELEPSIADIDRHVERFETYLNRCRAFSHAGKRLAEHIERVNARLGRRVADWRDLHKVMTRDERVVVEAAQRRLLELDAAIKEARPADRLGV